jgi:hypothetical protein
MRENLVNPHNYGIQADQIYYYREDIREKYDITLEELEAIGIKDGIMMVSERIIKPLLKAQQILYKYGFIVSL